MNRDSGTPLFSSATHSIPLQLDDSALALLIKVLTSEALCATGWCKSKGRYRLVCIAFLYTDVLIYLSVTLLH